MFVARPPEPKYHVALALVAVGLAVFGMGSIKLGDLLRGTGPILVLIGGIAVAVSVVLTLAVIGRFVLGPLDSAARLSRRPTQFTMADFLALMFLFQLPVALIRLVMPGEAQHGLLYGFAWVASSLMWGLSVQTLSRAGVETPWRRVVFLSAVLPIVYFGSVAFVGAALLAASAALFAGPARSLSGFWWFIAAGAVLPGGFYWAARFVRTMLITRQPADDAPLEPS
ncbi:MAG: hypothetical protein ACREHD_00435 [Pirellulales bacterium]